MRGRIGAVSLYLKAIGAGLGSAAATAAGYLAVKEIWSTLYRSFLLVPRAKANSDGGSWDAYYAQTYDIRIPLVVGFVVGFSWMLLRQRATKAV